MATSGMNIAIFLLYVFINNEYERYDIKVMTSAEKITGKRLNGIIYQLFKKRTILRLNLFGKDYEGLTIITGINNPNESSSFRIDFPGGAREDFPGTEGGRIFFDFSGEDKLQYTFRTVVEEVMEGEIRIGFPDSIERIQRRKDFRVTALSGTRAMLETGRGAFEFNVMNIGQGGILVNQNSELHDKVTFFVGSVLTDIRIAPSKEGGGEIVHIKKAEVRRVDKNSSTGKYQYALQFDDVSKRDDSLINNFIYMCQREVLKTRSYIAGV